MKEVMINKYLPGVRKCQVFKYCTVQHSVNVSRGFSEGFSTVPAAERVKTVFQFGARPLGQTLLYNPTATLYQQSIPQLNRAYTLTSFCRLVISLDNI